MRERERDLGFNVQRLTINVQTAEEDRRHKAQGQTNLSGVIKERVRNNFISFNSFTNLPSSR